MELAAMRRTALAVVFVAPSIVFLVLASRYLTGENAAVAGFGRIWSCLGATRVLQREISVGVSKMQGRTILWRGDDRLPSCA